MTDWNSTVIAEFRSNGGKVGGQFEGAPLLLLHSIGARTGEERVHPVMYQDIDKGYGIFASKAGADTNPDWYHNVLANPSARIEIGSDTIDVRARVAGPDEREAIWTEQKRRYPGFADYEQRTSRQIPVVILEPKN
jgi:deazaflavin-dependent oxidoreductase (nitroreductase family)